MRPVRVGIIYRPSSRSTLPNNIKMGKALKKTVRDFTRFRNDVQVISSQKIDRVNLKVFRSILVPNVNDIREIRLLREHNFSLISVGWSPLSYDSNHSFRMHSENDHFPNDPFADLPITFESSMSIREISDIVEKEIMTIPSFNISYLSV